MVKRFPSKYRTHSIASMVMVAILVPIVYFYIVPWIDEEVARVFRVPPKPPILLSVDPESLNLTIVNDNSATKRIDLNFGNDAINLLKPALDIPPGLDKNIDIIFNNTVKTRQYFVYIIANNANYSFPEGQFEGIMRFYYKDGNQILNKAIPIDVNVVKKEQRIN